MKSNLYLKITSFLILFLTIAASAVVIFFFKSNGWFLLIVPFYFYAVSGFGYTYLEKQTGKSPAKFISKYLLISTIRLFLHLIIILILLISCHQKVLTAVIFLLNYFVFNFYEVISWLRSQKNS